MADPQRESKLRETVEREAVRWTISLLLAGVAIGILNVYLFLRERP
ncbi:MAG: AtpZ/AtpI family protein [bacterium]